MAYRYAKTSGLLVTEQGGELIVFNPLNGSYFGLNSTGAEIWGLLDQFDSADQIAASLPHPGVRQTGELERLLDAYLDDLFRSGLVVRL